MNILLDVDTSTAGGIIQVILGIICLPVVFYLFKVFIGYIFGGMAKISNRRIVRHGRAIADPDTINAINEDIKAKAVAAKNGISQATNYLQKQINNKRDKDIRNKMEEIEILKEKGMITDQEYLTIRTEILKKYYA